jgi:hypothetical protein
VYTAVLGLPQAVFVPAQGVVEAVSAILLGARGSLTGDGPNPAAADDDPRPSGAEVT